MNRIVLSGLVVAALAGLPTTGLAHGGQYRGPGDVVPPNPGGGGARTPGPSGPTTPGPSGPTTPGPSGPSTPGPSGPSTGGPAGPAGPAAGPRTPRGVDQGPDLTKWQFWWEFNKDPYLNLKDSIHATSTVTGSDEFFLGASKTENTKDTLKPSDNDIMNTVLPALARALEGTTNRDITSSCIVAMAKIGKNNDAKNVKILDTFKKHLSSSEQEIRETAALALGISQMAEKGNLKDLVDLATDTPDGRKLAGRSEVDDRTRSFASYALGLVVHASTDVAAKASAFDALRSQLADEKISSRNQKVSAINGMRLLKLNAASADDKEKKLLDDVVAALWSYYEKKLGKGEQLIQAHVPPAIAQLIGRGNSKVHQKFKDAFLKDLDLNNESKLSESMTQSCAIALGLLAERTKEDEKYVDALAQYVGKGKDHMTKYFSLIALGEIGGDKARGVLLDFFNKGNKATIKPWSAIAIGIMSFKAMKEGGQNASVDVEAGRQLQATLKEVSNPEAKGAIAIGLGLMKYTDAADDLRDLLVKNKSQDEVAGYLSIGLALMNDSKSMEDIRSIVKTSIRRPDLLKQSAIALGKLGDKTITDVLQEMLTGGDMNVAKLSAVATAYGFIGDRRTIDPLVKLLFDDKLTDLSRAFAAVALGGVADKEALPWNSKIACDMNYRAAVETLTNQSTGILDIL